MCVYSRADLIHAPGLVEEGVPIDAALAEPLKVLDLGLGGPGGLGLWPHGCIVGFRELLLLEPRPRLVPDLDESEMARVLGVLPHVEEQTLGLARTRGPNRPVGGLEVVDELRLDVQSDEHGQLLGLCHVVRISAREE